MGIETSFVNPANLKSFEKAIRPNTKVIYAEVSANPTLAVCDIPGLAKLAKAHGIKLVVDNTFTPLVASAHQDGGGCGAAFSDQVHQRGQRFGGRGHLRQPTVHL
jgi:O-acetylhomoserine/O-acetylserine sulfhydrylase-like pyridoxal-dependent enzyme